LICGSGSIFPVFHPNAYPDLASKNNADPDPASKNNADPDPAFKHNADSDPAPKNNADLDPATKNNTSPDPAFKNNTDLDPAFKNNTSPDPATKSNAYPNPASKINNTDPDPAFKTNAYPNPAYKNNADPDPQLCIIRTFGINSLAGELRVLSSCRLFSLSGDRPSPFARGGDDFVGPDLASAAADRNGSRTKLLARCLPPAPATPRPFMRNRSTYTGYLSPEDLKALTDARGSAWIGVGRTWHCTQQ
jgi:hypothetical protein